MRRGSCFRIRNEASSWAERKVAETPPDGRAHAINAARLGGSGERPRRRPEPCGRRVGSPRSPARTLLPAWHTGRKNAYSAEPQLKLHTRLCGEQTRGEC